MYSFLKKYFIVSSFYWIVAAATFSGFIAKWGLSPNSHRTDLEKILNGTAHRPFVHRQLIPQLANFLGNQVPEEFVQNFIANYHYGPFRDYATAYQLVDASAEYKFKWLLVYWLTFFSLLGSLYLLRAILLHNELGEIAALFAPAIFCLCLPIFQTNGGFFYDYGELFFMSLTILLALKNRLTMLFFAVLFATLNKETFLFFIPTFYPLVPHLAQVKYLTRLKFYYLSLIILSASTYLWIKNIFINNPGQVTEVWFSKNIKNYINPSTYFKFDGSYGLIAPKGLNIITIFLVLILIKISWKYFPKTFKTHTLIALTINVPLFLVFAYINEIRNLSFLYITVVLLIAYAIEFYPKPSKDLVNTNLI
jgi:hypothetical protein